MKEETHKSERKIRYKLKYDYQSNTLTLNMYFFDAWGMWTKNAVQVICLDVSKTFKVMYIEQPLVKVKSGKMDTMKVDWIITDQEAALVKNILLLKLVKDQF